MVHTVLLNLYTNPSLNVRMVFGEDIQFHFSACKASDAAKAAATSCSKIDVFSLKVVVKCELGTIS